MDRHGPSTQRGITPHKEAWTPAAAATSHENVVLSERGRRQEPRVVGLRPPRVHGRQTHRLSFFQGAPAEGLRTLHPGVHHASETDPRGESIPQSRRTFSVRPEDGHWPPPVNSAQVFHRQKEGPEACPALLSGRVGLEPGSHGAPRFPISLGNSPELVALTPGPPWTMSPRSCRPVPVGAGAPARV